MGRPIRTTFVSGMVRAVIKGGLSRHQAAAQFGVGISTGDQLGPALPRDRQRQAGPDWRL